MEGGYWTQDRIGLEGWEINDSIGLPCLDCFVREEGRNAIPLLSALILVTSNCERSADLEGLVIANRNTVFSVNAFRGSDSDCP